MLDPPERLQVLITGPYRSGTGFFSLLLGNHPHIEVGHHTTNVPRYWDGDRVDWRGVDRNVARFTDGYRFALLGDWPPGMWWHHVMYAVFGSPRWAEKVQLAWRFVPTFLDWFPDHGKAIIVLRDPRSVLASFREYTYHDPPAYLGAAFNCLDAMRRARELFMDERVFVARYERYARRPTAIRGVLSWLGLDWPGTETMLDQSGWADVPGGPVSTRSAFEPVKRLDVGAAINRWRDHLSPDELRFVETVCGTEMERWGYEPVTGCDMEPGQMMEMCEGDKVAGWCRQWLQTGEGVEAFPADPTDPANWAEHNPRPAA